MSRLRITILAVLLAAGSVLTGRAQQANAVPPSVSVVPAVTKFSGTLTDVNGKPLSNITGITFSLYKDEQGGAPLWMETQNVTPDKNGHYSVVLGSVTAHGLPADVFAAGEARWLGIQAEGQNEGPRTLLVSVPYAMKALDAETLGGMPASAFLQAGGRGGGKQANPPSVGIVVKGSGTTNFLPLWTASSTLGNSALAQSGTNVGVGTASPAATLDVNGGADVRNTLTLFPAAGSAAINLAGTSFGVANTGVMNFVSGQTFPGTAQLSGSNSFTGNETVSGNVTSNGTVSGGMVNATTGFEVGGSLFGFGTLSAANVSLGFAGNTTATGNSNTGVGVFALQSNSTGIGNTAIGVNALRADTTGSQNTAVGQQALALDTVGFDNTATGQLALGYNTSASYNVADGVEALFFESTGSYNAAVGTLAGAQGTTGQANALLGFQAGLNTTTGSWNTASGTNTLLNNVTGNYNTALGYLSGPDSSGLSNSTAIGVGSMVSENNALILGQTIAGAAGAGGEWVNVGIGTAVPQSILEADVYAYGALGPTLTLTNTAGTPGSAASIDLNTYSPPVTGYNPAARILALDDFYGDDILFQSNVQGAPNQGLQTNMSILANGRVAIGPLPEGIALGQLQVQSTFNTVPAAIAYGFDAVPGGDLYGGIGLMAVGGNGDPSAGDGGYGVFVIAGQGATPGEAGFFSGDVEVQGNLSKSGGSFKIDDPVDPANKYLYHSFVESPDMMNIYNGNVTTDLEGAAVVALPEWFETLNRDFRYQLTVIGQFAQAIVAGEIANHQFSIKTDKPNVKVSWQVTGVRQDPWANAHRIPVEVEKNAKERGHYIHPELYGASEEQSIVAARLQEFSQKRMRAAAVEPGPATHNVAKPLAVAPGLRSLPAVAPSPLLQRPAPGLQRAATGRK